MITPGAIILGIEYQALGLLRQLRATGVPCVLIDQDRWGAARFSRYCQRAYQCPRYDSDQFWGWLVKLQEQERLDGWLLIATDDEQVRQIALHIEEANQRFRYVGPSWSLYEQLYDKRLNYRWCLKHGICSPISYLPEAPDDLPDGHLEYPFIVKPAFKRNFKQYSKAKAVVVNSRSQLESLLAGQFSGLDIHEILYQEIIPGGGAQQWSYAGLFVQGNPVAAFTACRVRQHPPDFGRASTYVVAEHNPEVEAESRKIMAALQYTGLGEVEWKRDPRDGQLRFLEVNARCWGWHTLASRVVGNLPRMLYDHAHAQIVPSVVPRYGAKWVKHITDIPVVLDMRRRHDLSLAEYFKSLQGNLIGCEWEWIDPAPFFLQVMLIPYLFKQRGY
jgi:predicted ATP-grasp superfamily ATP-dependent carboligase